MSTKNVCTVPMLLGASALGQTAKLNIAVNDLSPKGIQQSDAEIISERLRSELLNTGVFKVMERNDMASVLKEQGFQQTGACDEASCLVEVGQLLGVERMVAGSVGKIASMHTISLRMTNVATGEIGLAVNAETADAVDAYHASQSYDTPPCTTGTGTNMNPVPLRATFCTALPVCLRRLW
jgi:hypothetical protein